MPAMNNRVRLRPVTEDDLALFFEHQRDPEANRMAAFPAREKDAFMAHWAKVLADDTVTKMTILCDHEVAGNIVCWLDGDPLIGYWLGQEHWGQGIATRALTEFLTKLETRPLYAHVARNHVASIRVLEKCGFRVSSEEAEELILRLD